MTAKNDRPHQDCPQLFELLERIGRTFAQTRHEHDKIAGNLISMLRTLREQLEEHFHGEETKEGLFKQLFEQAPRVAHAVSELRDEHRAILLAARRLEEAVQQLDHTGAWSDAERQFEELHTRLRTHEKHENDLIQEVYLRDIAAAD